MSESKGVSNILEVLSAISLLANGGKKILKDGKVNLEDVPAALELIKKVDVIVAAVKDVKDVIPEAKDLSQEEVAVLLASLMSAVKSFQEA